MFRSTYVHESTFSTMNQIKSKNSNRMADETLDGILRFATIRTGIDIGNHFVGSGTQVVTFL